LFVGSIPPKLTVASFRAGIRQEVNWDRPESSVTTVTSAKPPCLQGDSDAIVRLTVTEYAVTAQAVGFRAGDDVTVVTTVTAEPAPEIHGETVFVIQRLRCMTARDPDRP
jgi:hypothetical protein